MKLMSKISTDIANSMREEKTYICDYVDTPYGIVPLTPACLSSEKICDYCHGKPHFTPSIGNLQPENPKAKIWLCANPFCDVYNKRSPFKTSQPTAKEKRSQEWPLFCEINNIGDEHYDVTFEKINQSQAKISCMFKFVSSPRGIILMRGDPGTGKTYAAMAICEFFTRTNTSAIFTTQKQMSNNWLETFKATERHNNYLERLSNVSLLVIDDFGTGEPNPKFMEVFMEVINTRLQWKSRGTVITTNLDNNKFSLYCGEALSDRIITGQIFDFKDKTRRKQTIL